MPAPDRPTPIRTEAALAWSFPRGLVGVYTAVEVDALIENAATGDVDLSAYAKTEELPEVFEQVAEPVGKDGDLWLAPAEGTAAADGDFDWARLTIKLGSGNIEVRQKNGFLQIRGVFTYQITSAASWISVLSWPVGIAAPTATHKCFVHGLDTGTNTNRIVAVQVVAATGDVQICALTGTTHKTTFNSFLSYAL
jgi:hypothetical protein